MPTLSQQIDGNLTLRQAFTNVSANDRGTLQTQLGTLSVAQMEAVLFTLTTDARSNPPQNEATAIRNFVAGAVTGNDPLTPADFHALVVRHGRAIGPSPANIRARLTALKAALMTGNGRLNSGQFVTLVTTLSAAGGQAIVTAVNTLLAGHAAPTPAVVLRVITGLCTASGQTPAMTVANAVALIARLATLTGAEIAEILTSLRGAAAGWLHTNYAAHVQDNSAAKWKALAANLRVANNWTADTVRTTLKALSDIGADTLEKLQVLMWWLRDDNADRSLAADAIEELAGAVGSCDQLSWAVKATTVDNPFSYYYKRVRDDGSSAAQVAALIDDAYRAPDLGQAHLGSILATIVAKGALVTRGSSFVKWINKARTNDDTITWDDVFVWTARFVQDWSSAVPNGGAELIERSEEYRLKVRDAELKHYVYGHTYAHFDFSRVNMKRVVPHGGEVSFWPQGTGIDAVKREAGQYIAKDWVKDLIGAEVTAASRENRRCAVSVNRDRGAGRNQYVLSQFYPTGGNGVARIHWQVLFGIGILIRARDAENPTDNL